LFGPGPLWHEWAVRLHCRDYGQGDPLIILHGLCGSLDNWHTVSRRLARRYHVLAVDQRNHGQSPHSDEMNYACMADDLLELFDSRSVGRARVLGHSMGGKTAMQFALAHPDKVASLVVVDIAPRAYAPVLAPVLASLQTLDGRSFPDRKAADAAVAEVIPDPAMRGFLLKSLGRDPAGVVRWKFNLPAILRNYSRLNDAIEFRRPFDRPTLFVRGGRSDFVQDSDQAAIRDLFPRAEIGTIAGAGHWIQSEAPDALLACLEPFLGAVPG
jgi:esterase